MNEVLTLEVVFNFGNETNTIYPVILKDEEEMILVDCGYPNFLPLIKKAAEEKGVNLDELTKIIVTHHDFDHMGALADFKRLYPNICIVSSYIEEEYINGKRKSLRLQQAEEIYPSLPDSQKGNAENFHKLLESIEPAKVDLLVKDKDMFPWCGGVEIISTPGHMPGHISIYLNESKILIAGDALVVEDDKIGIANPNYILDMEEAKMSIKKLQGYHIEKIICYHGGVYSKDIQESLENIF